MSTRVLGVHDLRRYEGPAPTPHSVHANYHHSGWHLSNDPVDAARIIESRNNGHQASRAVPGLFREQVVRLVCARASERTKEEDCNSGACGEFVDLQLNQENKETSKHFKVRMFADEVNEMLEQDSWKEPYKPKKVRIRLGGAGKECGDDFETPQWRMREEDQRVDIQHFEIGSVNRTTVFNLVQYQRRRDYKRDGGKIWSDKVDPEKMTVTRGQGRSKKTSTGQAATPASPTQTKQSELAASSPTIYAQGQLDVKQRLVRYPQPVPSWRPSSRTASSKLIVQARFHATRQQVQVKKRTSTSSSMCAIQATAARSALRFEHNMLPSFHRRG